MGKLSEKVSFNIAPISIMVVVHKSKVDADDVIVLLRVEHIDCSKKVLAIAFIIPQGQLGISIGDPL